MKNYQDKSSASNALVQKLWRFCNVLRDDGMSYPDYIEQLTFLLFLKMADEKGPDGESLIPSDCNWESLISKRGPALHKHYSAVIQRLGEKPGILGVIFGGARNRIKDPAKLQTLVLDLIGKEYWSSLDVDVKGEAYEGLLDKTAQDYKSGAGQYFTARPLVDAIVEVVKPQIGESVCDPACGTAGFLLAAERYMKKDRPQLTKRERHILRYQTFYGTELVDSVARLAAMNLLLHDIGPAANESEPPITVGDSLRAAPARTFDIVLTNPPFGKKSTLPISLRQTNGSTDALRPDFIVSSANKQVNFLQHVISLMKDGGRAAVVLPDNVLFEAGAAEVVRRYLIRSCERIILLRLPTGIFYAQGVKANVVFFFKKQKDAPSAIKHKINSRPVDSLLWAYDLRSGNSFSMKENPLKSSDLEDFVRLANSMGSKVKPRHSRWKAYELKSLESSLGARLDLAWGLTTSVTHASVQSSALDLGLSIESDLKAALSDIRATVLQLRQSRRNRGGA